MFRHNLRGLRGRMVLYFSLSAFAAAVSLSIVTYASTRAYLLDQRSELATSQAINNAQLLRTLVGVNPQDAGDIVTNIRTEAGGYAILYLNDEDSFFAQEPLRFTQSNLPTDLLTRTLGGKSSRQRFEFNGEPYEALGISISAISGHYFEAFPLTDVERTLNTIRTTLTFGIILITLAGGIFGFSSSSSVLRPLRRVASVATDIASGGLDVRLEDERDPELSRLADSFNNMVDAVQTRIQRETRFASDVSHELRSPITALAASVEVMQSRRDDLSDRNKQAFDIIASQVRRFDRTVLDLLELSRLDAGAGKTQEETVNLADLVKRVAQRHGFAEIPFATNLDDSDETVLDKRRIERIVLNLLENARDHAGGATAISVTGDERELRIAVEDAGAGVAQSERERIFERFARGTASRNSTGSGLGLAIVQEHARALGGKAWVEISTSGGARFMVSILRSGSTELTKPML
ncbi:MAG: ATP-binding protein [Actinomycetota bacterium]|nr:ATP-binding protein [Actinomycetota bacterium]